MHFLKDELYITCINIISTKHSRYIFVHWSLFCASSHAAALKEADCDNYSMSEEIKGKEKQDSGRQ